MYISNISIISPNICIKGIQIYRRFLRFFFRDLFVQPPLIQFVIRVVRSVTWIFTQRDREDITTGLSVFISRFSVENSDEFWSRQPPGLATRDQTSQRFRTFVWRCIKTQFVRGGFTLAGRSSPRIAGQSRSPAV